MRRIFISLALLLALSGCAKLSREYTPPTLTSIKNTQIFSADYNTVWKATVDAVAASFWTLSNIEKDSGIVSLFYITDNPRECIDCGTTKVEIKQFGRYAGTLVRNPAQSTYEYDTHEGRYHNVVKEKSELRCDCNIIVNELSSSETSVTVNTIYNLALFKGDTVIYNNELGKYVFTPEPVRMSFTSDRSGAAGGYVCIPTYELEKSIFSSIEKRLKKNKR